MSLTTIVGGGALTRKNIADINANFASLGSSTAGGALTSGHILVGNGSNIATDVAVSGAITMSNAGVTAIAASQTITSPTLVTPVLGVATGTSVNLSGNCRAASFNAGATAGATAGPFTTVASINVIGGIVTTLTGS